MTLILEILVALGLIGQTVIGLAFLISCMWEDEKRASAYAGFQFAGMLGLVVLFFYLKMTGFFDTDIGFRILIVSVVLGGLATYLLVLKKDPNPKALKGTEAYIVGQVNRFDERETVFSRNRTLRPGSEQYKQFYAEHPELEEADAARRKVGGPSGRPGSIDDPHHLPNVSASAASGSLCMHLSHPHIVKPRAIPALKGNRVALSPEEAATRVKGYALSLGAKLVGITKINPLWAYSHRGEIFRENWEDWGKPVDLSHPYAVVFAVEMNFRLIAASPHTPNSIDSQGRYAEGAFIATQVAAYIANMGYSATANHLRYYDSILVPLAVDAGLGEMGRLGYLMTKKLGPRVRLGAVTTDLPLTTDKPVDIGVEDFCRICKKCATCCPSSSIPMDEPTEVNGTRRWKLNAETCFDYWGKVGTGCNICMRVCPWSHASTLPHQLIRETVARNKISRKVFFFLDDIFYGKKPKPKKGPEWAKYD